MKITSAVALAAVLLGGCVVVPLGYDDGYYHRHYYHDHYYHDGYWWHGRYRYDGAYFPDRDHGQ